MNRLLPARENGMCFSFFEEGTSAAGSENVWVSGAKSHYEGEFHLTAIEDSNSAPGIGEKLFMPLLPG